MGLTVHYRGKIRDYALVDELVTEVEDFSRNQNWRYHLLTPGINTPLKSINQEDPEPLPTVKGIILSPDKCEPIILTFLDDGRICSPFMPPMEDLDGLPYMWTKTQYAGIDVHRSFINLLRQLNEKYFSQLIVVDEGQYWETNDEEVLQSQFQGYNQVMDLLADELENQGAVVEKADEDSEIEIESIYFDIKGSA
jgi:hypothetical protein